MNNLELYKTFKAVADTKSFSSAAKKLYITQPAVSQGIKQLETEFGASLFIRNSKGVTLTAEGEMLYGYVSSAFDLLSTGEEKIVKMKKLLDGELKIGAGDTISEHFILPVLEKFHNLYPNIKIQVINRTSIETIKLLKAGKIDLAFVNLPVDDNGLVVEKCLCVQDTFVAGSKFQFLKDKKLSLKELTEYPLVMLEKAANSRRYVDSYFLENGINLDPEIELGAHNLLIEFAKINLGISCVIKEFSHLEKNKSIFEIQLKEPIPKRWIGICTLASISPSQAASIFTKWCYSVFLDN